MHLKASSLNNFLEYMPLKASSLRSPTRKACLADQQPSLLCKAIPPPQDHPGKGCVAPNQPLHTVTDVKPYSGLLGEDAAYRMPVG